MKRFFLAFSAFLLHADNYAQNAQWTVKAGESIREVLGDSNVFRYPQFKPGSVYFRDGSASNALLNLNLVNGEMQFISSLRDTMTVDNEATIKYVTVNTDTFYFDKVFIESLRGNTVARLAKLQVIKPGDTQKVGAYDQPSSVSSINNNSYFYNGSQVPKLTERKVLNLHKETIYFIGDRFNHFLPAAKKNIVKLFYSKKPEIEAFIKENKIMLNKEEDLIKLIEFIEKA